MMFHKFSKRSAKVARLLGQSAQFALEGLESRQLLSAPLNPTGLAVANATPSALTLVWQDNANNETGFVMERLINGNWATIANLSVNSQSYTDSGLAASTAYAYRVHAFNASGNSAYSFIGNAVTAPNPVITPTPPAAPTSLQASPASSSQISLSWTDNANNETGFNIERLNGATWGVVGSVGANVTTYNDSGLTPSTSYSYRVVALNAAGPSAYSNTAVATTPAAVVAANPPSAPFYLSATSSSAAQVSMVWGDNNPAANETAVTVERQVGNGAFSVIATLPPRTLSYSDATTTGSTFYSYRIAAANSAGASGYSNISSVITPAGVGNPTPPAAPTGLSATANSSTQITLGWTDNANNETGFNVERLNGATWGVVASLGANVTTYADNGLNPSTAYSYRVVAVNAVGSSAYSNTAAATTQAAANPNIPAAPTNLSTKADLSTQITLTWTDNSNNETGFSIERLNGTTWTPIQTVAANTTTYSDANLTQNTSYSYRVSAVNTSGASAYTNVSTTTTPPTVLPNVPAAPTALSAVQISNTKMSLVWGDNSNNESAFNVERWNGTAWVVIVTLPANTTYYVDSGLAASTIYTYRVDATNAYGPSPYSNNSSGQTNATSAIAPRTDLSTFFPIGVFQQPEYTMSTWKARGVNTMVGFESYGALSTMATWTQSANDNGLKYMRQPSVNPASDINDPNLLSWLYNIDEPDLSDLATAQGPAQTEFNRLRAIDSTRPIATTYAGGYMLNWIQGVRDQAYYETMTQYTDWVMPCIYPVTGWNQPNNLNAVGQLVDRVGQWFPGKRNIAYIETSNQNLSWVGTQERGVTPGEYRAEVWDAVIHGATGIVYFPHSLSPFNYDATPADVAAELTLQDARLSKFGAALLSAQNPAGTSLNAAGTIETAWRVYNGHTYYFALNLSPNAVSNASLSTTGLGASQTLAVDGESRNVTLQGGNLVDSFQPYEAHIYVV